MKEVSQIVSGFKESIFATMSHLANQHQAINLSQGFPDFDGPSWLIQEHKKALDLGHQGKNQYAPSPGVLSLRQSVSENYRKFYQLEFSPETEITVTNGATEAIFISALALLNPGDEVVVLEPFYDSYVASIEMAGAVAIPVTLHAPQFELNWQELEAALGSKTKASYLNSPPNPSGKVFTKEELVRIGNLAKKYDSYIISDEVYEFLTFEDAVHIPIASLEDFGERTITISSTGKTFGLTGWKIGWACAPPALSHALRMVHQFNVFSVSHPAQVAMACALKRIDSYLPEFRSTYSKKRELFIEGLRNCNFNPLAPAGTYFVMCPIPDQGTTDIEYCKKLITEKKVAAIPPSAFYLKAKDGERYLRFCFAKKDETLMAALKNLA